MAAPSDWSRTETFKTKTAGFIIPGQEVYDPLTDGSTVGTRIGGHFVAGQGWQADSDSDGLFYDFGSLHQLHAGIRRHELRQGRWRVAQQGLQMDHDGRCLDLR